MHALFSREIQFTFQQEWKDFFLKRLEMILHT